MEQLFREFGAAGLAIVGAVAVMGFTWAVMYGNDTVSYKVRNSEGQAVETDIVSTAETLDQTGSVRYDKIGKAHRTGIDANEEAEKAFSDGDEPGYKKLGDFFDSVSMD